MTITYSHTKATLAADVQRLLRQTRWGNTRTEADIEHMMQHSMNIGAWDGDVLVGYTRVLTDGRFRAFIEDVVVDESRRGEGIGRGLLEHTLAQLTHIEDITLFCSDENVPFYQKFDFTRHTANALHIRRV